jgi:hypothetical protein
MKRLLGCLAVILLSQHAVAEVPANRLTTLSRGVNFTDVFERDLFLFC